MKEPTHTLSADDLGKISVWLGLVGYSIALLALEKLEKENEVKDKDKLKAAMSHFMKRVK